MQNSRECAAQNENNKTRTQGCGFFLLDGLGDSCSLQLFYFQSKYIHMLMRKMNWRGSQWSYCSLLLLCQRPIISRYCSISLYGRTWLDLCHQLDFQCHTIIGMYTIMFRLCRQPTYWITMLLMVADSSSFQARKLLTNTDSDSSSTYHLPQVHTSMEGSSFPLLLIDKRSNQQTKKISKGSMRKCCCCSLSSPI